MEKRLTPDGKCYELINHETKKVYTVGKDWYDRFEKALNEKNEQGETVK